MDDAASRTKAGRVDGLGSVFPLQVAVDDHAVLDNAQRARLPVLWRILRDAVARPMAAVSGLALMELVLPEIPQKRYVKMPPPTSEAWREAYYQLFEQLGDPGVNTWQIAQAGGHYIRVFSKDMEMRAKATICAAMLLGD